MFEKYAVNTEEGFLAYESGAVNYVDKLVTGSKIRPELFERDNLSGIMKAMSYAEDKGLNPTIVKIRVCVADTEVGFEKSFKEDIREHALGKLSGKEKEVLGVG